MEEVLGYDTKLISGPIDEDLICIICANVVCEAMECSKCNSLFCKRCIDIWLKQKKECPSRCKMNKDAVIKPASRIVGKLVKKMTIRCKYCSESMKIEFVEEHERICKIPKCANPLCRTPFIPEQRRIAIGKDYSGKACSELCRLVGYFDMKTKSERSMKESNLMVVEIFESIIRKVIFKKGQLGGYAAEQSLEEGQNILEEIKCEGDDEEEEGSFSRRLTTTPIEFTWEKMIHSRKLSMSKDRRAVFLCDAEFTYRNIYSSVPFHSGTHYWEIILDSNTQHDMKIGVSKKNDPSIPNCFSDYEHGWGYYGMGELRHSSNVAGGKYGKKFRTTGIVGVALDMERGTLSFALDGEYLGVAFTDDQFKIGPIYPALGIIGTCGCYLVSGKRTPKYFD